MIQRGFTLIELVVIIVLIGILAVYAIPSTKSDLTAWNAADELMQAIRYTQQKSLDNTGQPPAGIRLESNGFSFMGSTSSLGVSWNLQLPSPAYTIDISPTGTILFNGRGVPTCGGGLSCGNSSESITITANGNSTTFFLEPYTGLVHR